MKRYLGYYKIKDKINKLWNLNKDEIQTARKPWMPNDHKAKDLKKTDKLLYSISINSNQPTLENMVNNFYKTQFGLPLESARPHLRTLSKSNSLSQASF